MKDKISELGFLIHKGFRLCDHKNAHQIWVWISELPGNRYSNIVKEAVRESGIQGLDADEVKKRLKKILASEEPGTELTEYIYELEGKDAQDTI